MLQQSAAISEFFSGDTYFYARCLAMSMTSSYCSKSWGQVLFELDSCQNARDFLVFLSLSFRPFA